MTTTDDLPGMVSVYRGLEAGMREAADISDPESIRWWLSAREARERMQRRSHQEESPMT